MKKPRLIIGLGLVFIALGLLWRTQTPSLPPPVASLPAPSAAPSTPFPPLPPEPPAEPAAPTAPEPEPIPGDVPAPGQPAPPEVIRTELENLQVSFRDYRTIFGENPVGSNAEITQVLNGGNPKHLRVSFPPGSSINERGELCDRWAVPFFFHQLSAKQMEIHSAGPDRMMGTGDDVVVK